MGQTTAKTLVKRITNDDNYNQPSEKKRHIYTKMEGTLLKEHIYHTLSGLSGAKPRVDFGFTRTINPSD